MRAAKANQSIMMACEELSALWVVIADDSYIVVVSVLRWRCTRRTWIGGDVAAKSAEKNVNFL